jgi:hypothetical protein
VRVDLTRIDLGEVVVVRDAGERRYVCAKGDGW